jgi:hypothetical protein
MPMDVTDEGLTSKRSMIIPNYKTVVGRDMVTQKMAPPPPMTTESKDYQKSSPFRINTIATAINIIPKSCCSIVSFVARDILAPT